MNDYDSTLCWLHYAKVGPWRKDMGWVIAFRQKALLDKNVLVHTSNTYHNGILIVMDWLSSNSNNCNSSNLNASQGHHNTTVYGHFFSKILFYGFMMDCKVCLYGCCTHSCGWILWCRQTINKIKMIQNNKCPWTQWTMGSLRWIEWMTGSLSM